MTTSSDHLIPEPHVKLDIKNINNLIIFWRKKRQNAETDQDALIASCYIDAFQCVRVNHNLQLLPLKIDNENES